MVPPNSLSAGTLESCKSECDKRDSCMGFTWQAGQGCIPKSATCNIAEGPCIGGGWCFWRRDSKAGACINVVGSCLVRKFPLAFIQMVSLSHHLAKARNERQKDRRIISNRGRAKGRKNERNKKRNNKKRKMEEERKEEMKKGRQKDKP